eukprot:3698818-Rhodomonas_salina.3
MSGVMSGTGTDLSWLDLTAMCDVRSSHCRDCSQTHDKPTRKSMLDAVNKVPGSVARYPCSPSSIAPLVLNGGTRRVYEADFVLGRSDWPYY